MNAIMDSLLKGSQQVAKSLDEKSPAILVGVGLVGFAATVVLAVKATPDANEVIEDTKKDLDEAVEVRETYPEEYSEEELKKEKASLYFDCAKGLVKLYGPAFLLGVSSTYCILKAQKIQSTRFMALATAYQITDASYKEYKNKVVETLGEKKERKIVDEINKDKVKNNPPENNEVFVTGRGDTLCYDSMSGRYFYSSPEKIRQAQNVVNALLIDEDYVSLNTFYYEIGLPAIDLGEELGWNVDDPGVRPHGVEMIFTSSLTDVDRPCLVVSYDIAPRYDYANLH